MTVADFLGRLSEALLRGQDELDWTYLERWAEELGVTELLAQAAHLRE